MELFPVHGNPSVLCPAPRLTSPRRQRPPLLSALQTEKTRRDRPVTHSRGDILREGTAPDCVRITSRNQQAVCQAETAGALASCGPARVGRPPEGSDHGLNESRRSELLEENAAEVDRAEEVMVSEGFEGESATGWEGRRADCKSFNSTEQVLKVEHGTAARNPFSGSEGRDPPKARPRASRPGHRNAEPGFYSCFFVPRTTRTTISSR